MAYIERPRFSCALGGALETITSLPGVVPIIHASSGCGGNLFGSQQIGGGYGSGYCGGLAVPSSNVSEREIIFGGEERLIEQITTTLEIIDAELFIVVTGCMTEIIGDDARSVVNSFRDSETPVLAVNTSGFIGNSYKGYDLVLQTLFTEYVPKAVEKDKNLVNILGLVPGKDPFFRGDLEEIKRLLSLIGIKANTFFTYNESLENLYDAGKASLNIILSKTYGVETAQSFQEKHDTPFIVEDLPVGAIATEEFLYKVAQVLNIDKQLVSDVVSKEKKYYYSYIERIGDLYFDSDFQHYAIIATNANYSYPITRFLIDDIGWLPELSVITDSLDESQKEVIKASFSKIKNVKAPEVVFETNASEIQKYFSKDRNIFIDEKYVQSLTPLFILGSTLEKDLADTLSAKFLGLSFPLVNRVVIDRGYSGFKGGLHLLEDILNELVARR